MKQSVKVCLQQHVSYRAAWLASYYATTATTAPTTTNTNTTTNNNTNNTTGEANSDSMIIESSLSPPLTLPIRNEEVKEVEEEKGEEEEYMGCKYLTSPSLFQLQLSDPNLRQEIITQIIIFLHHFSCRLPFILEAAATATASTSAIGSNVVSIKGKVVQATSRLATTTAAAAASATTTTTTTIATTGRGAKGSVTVTTASAAAASKTEVIPTPTTTATPSALTPIEIAVKNIRHDIALIRKKAYQQLSVTPPNGSELLPFLQRLLQREEHWIAWKKTACIDFERPPATLPTPTTISTTTDTIITTSGGGKKIGSISDSIVVKSGIYVR